MHAYEKIRKMVVIFFDLHVNNLAENISLKTKQFPSTPEISTSRSTFLHRFCIHLQHSKHAFLSWKTFFRKNNNV